MSEPKNIKVVDNYSAAKALDRLKKLFIDPLQERVTKGMDHVTTKDPHPDKEKQKQIEVRLEALRVQLSVMQGIYEDFRVLIHRHEHLTNEVARHYYNMRENIVWKGKIPPELMSEQVEMLSDYYNALGGLLKEIEL